MERDLKIFIVDDEYHIGQLIGKLLHWDELHVSCGGIFDKSTAALEKIESEHPDIVITDIRMPKIDGLEMIRRVRMFDPQCHFIVISGYREFEYAHRALEYGVEDYILKPVNEEELNAAVEKCKKNILESEHTNEIVEQMRAAATESQRIIKGNLLNSLLNGQMINLETDSRVNFKGDTYRGIDVKLDITQWSQMNDKQAERTSERVMDQMENGLNDKVSDLMICRKDNLHIYCLLNYEKSREKDIDVELNSLLMDIKDALLDFDQFQVTIGEGNAVNEFMNVQTTLHDAYRAVCNRLRYGTGRIIEGRQIPPASIENLNQIWERHRENLKSYKDALLFDEFSSEIMTMFSELLNSENDMESCYILTDRLMDFTFGRSEKGEEEEKIRQELIQKCQHCSRFTQLKKVVAESLGKYLENRKIASETRSVKPIRQALQYLKDHYSEKIFLEDVASEVGLNAVYFSTLFKKETNTNFSTYLVNLRMDKAKELLVSTNNTIAMIAEEVGYKDQKYFSQLFKKTVGVKPVLYRKLHS